MPDIALAEARELAARFGPTLHRTVAINATPFWDVIARSRRAEVCMVVRRANGQLLTCTKPFYPPGTYRLMTGGVEAGERVYAALLREVHEETGLAVAVRRLLAVIAYHARDAGADAPARFGTFAFLVDETGGTLGVTDPDERIAAYRAIVPGALPALADALDALPRDLSQ